MSSFQTLAAPPVSRFDGAAPRRVVRARSERAGADEPVARGEALVHNAQLVLLSASAAFH
jgi:hypothetical protein